MPIFALKRDLKGAPSFLSGKGWAVGREERRFPFPP